MIPGHRLNQAFDKFFTELLNHLGSALGKKPRRMAYRHVDTLPAVDDCPETGRRRRRRRSGRARSEALRNPLNRAQKPRLSSHRTSRRAGFLGWFLPESIGSWSQSRGAQSRRALHLVLERPALIEAVKDISPMQVGGFIYPFSEFATPKEELFKRLGYQSDSGVALKEARALMAEAGHGDGLKGVDFLVRDGVQTKIWAQAIQAMLMEGLNVQSNLRTVTVSVWFADSESGNYDLSIGVVLSNLLDPSDYFNSWYRSGGVQNYSFWNNNEFDALMNKIDREVEPAERVSLVHQAEAILEQNPPILPVAWEKVNDVWYDYVKGHNPYDYFGTFDVVRMDTVWLDK